MLNMKKEEMMMKMKYIKPFTEVVALNLNDHLLQEGELTNFSVYDKDGTNKDSTGDSGSGRPPIGGAKHYNAWETWD